MGKKLIVVSAFAVAAIIAGQLMSTGQDRKIPPAPATTVNAHPLFSANSPDIELEIHNLFTHLQWEAKAAIPAAEFLHERNKILAKHAELLKLLTKYTATERVTKAISDLELIIKDSPDSDEAKKAATAIETLKGDAAAEERARKRNEEKTGA